MQSLPMELPIPPIAANDSKSIELLRVWASNGQQHISLASGIWKDPATWGIMLADLAKHIANALEQLESVDKKKAMERLKAGFDAEWISATALPTGSIVEK